VYALASTFSLNLFFSQTTISTKLILCTLVSKYQDNNFFFCHGLSYVYALASTFSLNLFFSQTTISTKLILCTLVPCLMPSDYVHNNLIRCTQCVKMYSTSISLKIFFSRTVIARQTKVQFHNH
jgi:hypothetical protein